MLAGVVVLPTAPLLVRAVNAELPDDLEAVRAAVQRCVGLLDDHDVAVLVAEDAGPAGPGGWVEAAAGRPTPVHSVFTAAETSLQGIGLAGVALPVEVDPALAAEIGGRTGFASVHDRRLPLGLAILDLLLADAGAAGPRVPVAVASTTFAELVEAGRDIGGAILDTTARVAVVVAGDLAAGLSDKAPLHLVEGARDWSDGVLDVVDSGRLDSLKRFGPDEAARVGARGWPSLAVLHGITARTKVGLVRRHHSAPLGVGYLVAHGA